jgi:hypothetical protein
MRDCMQHAYNVGFRSIFVLPHVDPKGERGLAGGPGGRCGRWRGSRGSCLQARPAATWGSMQQAGSQKRG